MKKKKTSLLMIGAIAIVLSIAGVTYAYWQLRVAQTNENTITSSCFEVTLEKEGESITLDKAYPISDSDGEALEPYTFTIANKCDASASYQINLESLTKLNDGNDVLNRLDEQYLKVKLNEVGEDGSIQELTNDNKVNATLVEGQTEGQARADKGYKLKTGYLGPNAEKQYELRIWLKGDLTTDDVNAMNKTYASKITVITSYVTEDKIPPVAGLELTVCENTITAKGSGTTSGNKNITKYEFKIDTEEWADNAEKLTKEFTELGNGSHTVSFRVTDNKEMTSETSKTVEINYVDSKTAVLGGQTIDLVTSGSGLYKVGHCNVTGTVDDTGFSKEEYRYAGVSYVGTSWYAYKGNGSDTEEGVYSSLEKCISNNQYYVSSNLGTCEITQHPNTEDYVHNYVRFNKELWRIIGLVNVKVDKGDGKTAIEQRLKIIKEEPLQQKMRWSWSDSNYWTFSNIMTYLNTDYYNQENVEKNDTLQDSLSKNMIDEEIIWNIGGSNNPQVDYTILWYQKERNLLEWGKNDSNAETFHSIALMSPSDYGYATNGGTLGRNACFNEALDNWSATECANNNWLKYVTMKELWILAPYSNGHQVFYLYKEHITLRSIDGDAYVLPTVYLKENVHIKDNGSDGSYDNPYELELVEE